MDIVARCGGGGVHLASPGYSRPVYEAERRPKGMPIVLKRCRPSPKAPAIVTYAENAHLRW